ncbi:MAG TPA: MFS transporter [Bacteroidales bacterium]|nr:MFS transporter [Bacteroidales bacterium]
MIKNSKKVINAWCSYDIANSAYSLSISTVLYPIYYGEITNKAWGSSTVEFLGRSFQNTALYDYAIASGFLLVILLTPLLSGIADMAGLRKRFMQMFTYIGALSCIALYWFNGNNIFWGVLFPALAVVGFAGSLVYYNSFLPLIATPEQHDRISARGFSWGYAGSMVLLIINLFCIEKYEMLGFPSKLDAVRFAFLEVGVWWLLISLIAFRYLKEERKEVDFKRNIYSKGFREIITIFHSVRKQAQMKLFLLAFFLYSVGVQTIILVSTLFGSKELGMSSSELIVTILLIQILGIAGSIVFGRVSSRFGNKQSLGTMLIIWVAVCSAGYFIKTNTHFFVLASMVGLVMGGIQSQSRSTYSKMIPEDSLDTSSYFSFYDITEKVAIVVGMFGFGLLEELSGSMRNSVLFLGILFLLSLIVVLFSSFRVRVK